MEFIYFEESWNGNWKGEIHKRGTGSTRETKDDAEGSRGSVEVLKKDKA